MTKTTLKFNNKIEKTTDSKMAKFLEPGHSMVGTGCCEGQGSGEVLIRDTMFIREDE